MLIATRPFERHRRWLAKLFRRPRRLRLTYQHPHMREPWSPAGKEVVAMHIVNSTPWRR